MNIIFLAIILVSTIIVVNYGIYTIKDNNKTGAFGLFLLAAMTALTSVYFLMQ